MESCPRCGNADIKKFGIAPSGREYCLECGYGREPRPVPKVKTVAELAFANPADEWLARR